MRVLRLTACEAMLKTHHGTVPRGVSASVVDAGSHRHSRNTDGEHSIEKL